MLQTQIGYWQNVETNRHNLVTEAQNAVDLGIKQNTLQETIRHNKTQEDIGWFNAQETQRHNIVNENVAWFNAQEQQRHNYETENISWYNAYETKRHNVATENIGYANVSVERNKLAETARHNSVQEAQKLISLGQEGDKRTSNTKDVNQRIIESQANTQYIENKSRTETSMRFKNYTAGFQSIVTSAKSISEEARNWLKSATSIKSFK